MINCSRKVSFAGRGGSGTYLSNVLSASQSDLEVVRAYEILPILAGLDLVLSPILDQPAIDLYNYYPVCLNAVPKCILTNPELLGRIEHQVVPAHVHGQRSALFAPEIRIQF